MRAGRIIGMRSRTSKRFLILVLLSFFRSTLAAPVWQWAGVGTGGSMAIRQPVLGWHSLLFRKHGSDAATLSADGQPAVVMESAGVNLGGTLVLGDPANITSSGHEIARLVICNSGNLTAWQAAAVQAWLG